MSLQCKKQRGRSINTISTTPLQGLTQDYRNHKHVHLDTCTWQVSRSRTNQMSQACKDSAAVRDF